VRTGRRAAPGRGRGRRAAAAGAPPSGLGGVAARAVQARMGASYSQGLDV
jgi:hypothetical protein